MNWQEALNEIQSVEFDVNLNVVSSTDAFFEAVAREPAVLEAYDQMRNSGDLREEALGRLCDLVWTDADPRYENPNDTPLAVLLWLTNFAASDFAAIAAGWVDQAPRCWHAKKLAQRILNPPPSRTANHEVSARAHQSWNTADNAIDKEFLWAHMSNQSPGIRFSFPVKKSSTPNKTWTTSNRGADTQSEGTT